MIHRRHRAGPLVNACMLVLACALAASASALSAQTPTRTTAVRQDPATPSSGDSATVVPGPEYRAGSVVRFLVGSGYRGLWTEPIRVPVLDPEHFAGGLAPIKVGATGGQTWPLHVLERV